MSQEPLFRFALTKDAQYPFIKINKLGNAYYVKKDAVYHVVSTPIEIAAVILND